MSAGAHAAPTQQSQSVGDHFAACAEAVMEKEAQSVQALKINATTAE